MYYTGYLQVHYKMMAASFFIIFFNARLTCAINNSQAAVKVSLE